MDDPWFRNKGLVSSDSVPVEALTLNLSKAHLVRCRFYQQGAQSNQYLSYTSSAPSSPRSAATHCTLFLMAAEGSHLAAGSQQVQQPPNREAPTSTGPQSVLPHPSRLELSSWWKKFRKSTEKSEDKSEQFYTSCCTYTYNENLQTVPSHLRHSQFSFLSPSQSRLRSASIRPVKKRILKHLLGRIAPGIFGVPLAESIRYANVAISLTNEQGESFIYGYVPIVVAKCGVFLKEKGRL